MKIKKEHILLTCIMLIGVIARIIKFEDSAIVMDTVAFSRLGKNLVEYGRYVFGENYNMGIFFPPGYPVFIGVMNLFFDDLILSARLVSFIASCFSIILAYFIGKELYNKEAGLFAALVYALYPAILIISVDTYSDALFICFLLLSIYLFIVSIRKERLYYTILFGVSMSVAFLVRPEGMFLLLLPGLRLFGVFGERLCFNRKYLLSMVLIFIIFAVVISPYMLFVKNYTGKFTLSGKGNTSIILGELSCDREYHYVVNSADNLYDRAAFTLNEDKTQLRGWNKKVNLSMKDYILKAPVSTIYKYLKNVMREIYTLVKLLAPIILPLFFSFFNRKLFSNRLRIIFFIYPCLFFFMYPLFIIIEKQTLAIVLFLIFFSSDGFERAGSVVLSLSEYYGIKKNIVLSLTEKYIKHLIVAIFIISTMLYLEFSKFENTAMPAEHERAGVYLKEKLAPEYEELNIMARQPFVNYYSGARFTMMPYANIDDVINFAKLHKVDYIVVDQRALAKWDHYDELLELQKHSDDVELFYEDTSGPLIRLFKINR